MSHSNIARQNFFDAKKVVMGVVPRGQSHSCERRRHRTERCLCHSRRRCRNPGTYIHRRLSHHIPFPSDGNPFMTIARAVEEINAIL